MEGVDWTAAVVIHFMTWTDSPITNSRVGIVSGVGVVVIVKIVRHQLRIYTCTLYFLVTIEMFQYCLRAPQLNT